MEAIWKLVPPLIKPFYIDETIDWETKSLETNSVSMEFKDEEVAGQYRRFAHRDFVIGILSLMMWGGTLIYPLAGMSKGKELCLATLYTSHALYWLINPPELIAHLFYENTVRVATFRRYFQFGIAALSTVPTTFCAVSTFYQCPNTVFPLKAWGAEGPKPDARSNPMVL
jgi:hypothetical protein